MLYNDPENVTVKHVHTQSPPQLDFHKHVRQIACWHSTLKKIFTEMASLFPDEVFSMGGDEPYIIGNCTCEHYQSIPYKLQ